MEEEASIFRTIDYIEYARKQQVKNMVAACLTNYFTLKMEAVHFS
jgi:hypothetical protein